jgi:DNA-binding transcriptional LysR family regulator
VLRDPFVMVMPSQSTLAPEDLVRGETDLPFLRFTTGQIIAQQIEAQLKRMKYTLPNRFECGNNQTLMAMVSVGAGWTITTPLLFARARQFHSHLKMQPFPGRAFARELSLISTPDCANSVRGIIEGKLRQMLADHAILPVLEKAPWLADSFRLLGGMSDPAEADESEETES